MVVLQLDTAYYSSQLLNGLFLGCVLALASIGLSLVFGIMKIINFAHGDILLVGAYIGFEINRLTSQFLIAILGAVLSTLIIGILIELVFLRRLYGRENRQLEQVTLTVGLAFVLRELVIIRWGSTSQFIEVPRLLAGRVNLGFTSYPVYRLVVILTTVAILITVYLSLKQTKTGMMIRAGSKDRDMARMSGIDIKRLGTVGYAGGAALAGVAGVLIAPVRNAYPLLGFELLLPAFVIVVTGGLSSITGTIIAALLVGQVITFTSLVAAPMSDIVIFIIMAIALIFRSDSLVVRGEDI